MAKNTWEIKREENKKEAKIKTEGMFKIKLNNESNEI